MKQNVVNGEITRCPKMCLEIIAVGRCGATKSTARGHRLKIRSRRGIYVTSKSNKNAMPFDTIL